MNFTIFIIDTKHSLTSLLWCMHNITIFSHPATHTWARNSTMLSLSSLTWATQSWATFPSFHKPLKGSRDLFQGCPVWLVLLLSLISHSKLLLHVFSHLTSLPFETFSDLVFGRQQSHCTACSLLNELFFCYQVLVVLSHQLGTTPQMVTSTGYTSKSGCVITKEGVFPSPGAEGIRKDKCLQRSRGCETGTSSATIRCPA